MGFTPGYVPRLTLRGCTISRRGTLYPLPNAIHLPATYLNTDTPKGRSQSRCGAHDRGTFPGAPCDTRLHHIATPHFIIFTKRHTFTGYIFEHRHNKKEDLNTGVGLTTGVRLHFITRAKRDTFVSAPYAHTGYIFDHRHTTCTPCGAPP